MQHHKIIFVLTVLIFSGANGQDTTTNIPATTTPFSGDPTVCIPNSVPSPDPTKLVPIFDNIAEFGLEIETEVVALGQRVRQITKQQHFYDKRSNKAIIITNANGIILTDVYDYDSKYRFEYFSNAFCSVSDIPIHDRIDGRAAVVAENGSYYIRDLPEYLLFAYKNRAGQEFNPVYRNTTVFRGIDVDVWETCFVDQARRQTIHRLWYLATREMTTDYGVVGNKAVPIYGKISVSEPLGNTSDFLRTDEDVNVEFYKPGISERRDAFAPPRGVVCEVPNNTNAVSLGEIGIRWPYRFTVRVEATNSRSSRWERFHLSYVSGRGGDTPYVRYDFLPEGDENYRSIIHDNSQMLTYEIDERRGTCRISRRTKDPDYSPIRNPIEFFIVHAEDLFLYPSPARAWVDNGVRNCRTDGIECITATTAVPNFPPLVDSDTGFATGETWTETTIEYAWSRRSLTAPIRPNATRLFNYPVSLFLRFYRLPTGATPSPANIRVEDLEYEFFDMGEDVSPYVFDISGCYRSNDFEYIHLYIRLRVDRDGFLDSPMFNRREFEDFLRFRLAQTAQVQFIRISELDFDHEHMGHTVTAFFTLLGQIYIPETSQFNTSEPTAADAMKNLQAVVDAGNFVLNLTQERQVVATFTAVSGSVNKASSFQSRYVSTISPSTEYASGAQALSIIVGLLVGLIVGVAAGYIIYRFRGKQTLATSSVANPRQSVGFTKSQPTESASNA